MSDSLVTSSYHSFKKCLAVNWCTNIEKEIERIIANRINCSKSHHLTPKANSTSFGINKLSHEEEEMNLLEEIVAQVAENELKRESDKTKSIVEPVSATTIAPSASTTTDKVLTQFVSSVGSSSASLLTMPPETTTAKPSHDIVPLAQSSSIITTVSPSSVVEMPPLVTSNHTPVNVSSASLDNVTVAEVSKTTQVIFVTNKKQEQKLTTTQKPVVVIATPTNASTPTTLAPSVTTTSLPIIKVTTKSPTIVIAGSTTASTAKVTTVKDVVSPTKAQTTSPTVVQVVTIDAESLITTEKPKKSTIVVLSTTTTKHPQTTISISIAAVKKAKIDEKAQKAIEDLISQRQNAKKGAIESHEHESRLHAIEHERQMAIDPIGHIIKHEKYEQAKQQKLMALRAQITNNS